MIFYSPRQKKRLFQRGNRLSPREMTFSQRGNPSPPRENPLRCQKDVTIFSGLLAPQGLPMRKYGPI